MSASRNRLIPVNCTTDWLDDRLARRLSSTSDKREALSLWVQDSRDAWGDVYELQSILRRAHSEAPRIADARRSVERVLRVVRWLTESLAQRTIAHRRRQGLISRAPARPRVEDEERSCLCHLAALWGLFSGVRLHDRAPIPNCTQVETLLANLGKRYHREVARLHRTKIANPVLYGPRRTVRLVDGSGSTLREVRGAGVTLKSVFRDPASGGRHFKVEFAHAGGKRRFEVELPVGCDLETVELPKPKPAPKIHPPAPETEACLDLLTKLTFLREPLSEVVEDHNQRFRRKLPWRLLDAAHGLGVRLGTGRFRLGSTTCSGWLAHEGEWDVEWGISLVNVDLVAGTLRARFDTPSGQQFASIPLSGIIQWVHPPRQVIDGVLMLPGNESRRRLYAARRPFSDGDISPWVFGRSIPELRTMVPIGRRERACTTPGSRRPIVPTQGRPLAPDSDSSFDQASAALQGSFFD